MPQVLSTVVGIFFLQLLLLLRDFFNLSSFSFTHTPRFLFLYIFPPLSLLAAHGSYFYFIATVHHFAYSEIPTDNKYDFIHSIKKTPRLVTFWHLTSNRFSLYQGLENRWLHHSQDDTYGVVFCIYSREKTKLCGLIHSIFLEIILECYWTTGGR